MKVNVRAQNKTIATSPHHESKNMAFYSKTIWFLFLKHISERRLASNQVIGRGNRQYFFIIVLSAQWIDTKTSSPNVRVIILMTKRVIIKVEWGFFFEFSDHLCMFTHICAIFRDGWHRNLPKTWSHEGYYLIRIMTLTFGVLLLVPINCTDKTMIKKYCPFPCPMTSADGRRISDMWMPIPLMSTYPKLSLPRPVA